MTCIYGVSNSTITTCAPLKPKDLSSIWVTCLVAMHHHPSIHSSEQQAPKNFPHALSHSIEPNFFLGKIIYLDSNIRSYTR